MKIQLRDLTEISNNSVITNYVLNAINNKFDDKEKRDFLEWIKIIKNNKDSFSRKNFNTRRFF